MPQHKAALFVIRPFVLTVNEALPDASDAEKLIAALRSMSPESRRYKNIDASFDPLLTFLEQLRSDRSDADPA